MLETRSNLAIKYGAAKSLMMWHYFNKRLPLYLVGEFPKSGGTWFSQLLAATLQVPFPRNRAPKIESSIMHGHFPYHKNFDKMVYILRDGRDIIVSAYYYYLIPKDGQNNTRINQWRQILDFKDYHDIENNLPRFIEFFMETYQVFGKNQTWQAHVSQHLNNDKIILVRYEDLLADAAKEIQRVLTFYDKDACANIDQVVEQFSFENQTKRKNGQEDTKSFLRKGIAGDWKNNFTNSSAKIFHQYAGKILIDLAYEKNDDWINL